MWIALSFILLAAGAAVHFTWRERWKKGERIRRQLQRELAELRDEQTRQASQLRAHQLAVFNSMLEGILILDASGRIHLVNRALELLFHLPADVRGRSVMETFRVREIPEIAERARQEGVVRGFELRLPALYHTRYLEVNAAALQATADIPQGCILIFHDLTRLKELENVRKEFVANVSHELRTPLTLIKGYVETLIDGAKDDPAVTGRFLQTIHKHADRLTFIIEDLLTLSHLESGHAALQRRSGSLQPAVDRVLEELRGSAGEKNISLENQVPADLQVSADGDRLHQVLCNLVDNAIKYGRAGGLVRITAAPEEGQVRISVQDDGPGIPAEAQERIFERFYRVDRGRSREQGGTGLGLAIVKHIVQAHGGKVWVDSQLEQGSTFHFTLPDPTALSPAPPAVSGGQAEDRGDSP